MNNNLQEPTTQVSARRKLIRGAFSVPAVLAVHNGSALAASSNKMRCAVNAVTGNQPLPTSNVTAPDTWVRVQRYKRSSNNKPFVRMADIITVASTLGIGVATGATAAQAIRWSDGAILTRNDLVIDSTNLVALRFDNGGLNGTIRIVGIVTQGQSGGAAPFGTNAIATTCWNSMMP